MVDRMPPEVLEQLFLKIDNPFDVFNLRAVCKQWHAVITNERFLNIYFKNRFGIKSSQQLEWVKYCNRYYSYLTLPDCNRRYQVPTHLQGTGSVVLNNMHRTYTASFPRFPFPFYNHDYSIGMWLQLTSGFEQLSFEIRCNDFSLEFCLSEKSLRVQCSHMGGLEAETHIKVPFHRWFHIVLTYSSVFVFYINGYAYPLICNAGPLCKQEMIKRTTDIDKNKYLILSHEGYPKFGIISRFADIQVLPCALTRCEIKAIVEQKTCIGQLDMSRYLLEHWTSMHWYSKYLPSCILF
ncbi:unnamed protein product [Adineta steineri]|uniref:F-box domain-containing protein n=1 Tax=Adineta steineri TaxID=433720 RepID=A0A815Q4K6_9BILA|nr:unnamed protein product [Adineta steineri]CAF3778941.1 unnamed protein product [Adineta steineri]